MPTTTTRIGYKKFAGSDDFHISDWDDNMDLADLFVGDYICDSGSRPTTWGGDQIGMSIYEIDTKLHWRWNGSSFERSYPKGWLGGTARTTAFSTSATAPTMVTEVEVDIPDSFPVGTRRYMVSVEGPSIDNANGQAHVAIWRDTTQLQAWLEPIDHTKPGKLHMVTFDRSASADSTYTYSLQVNSDIAVGGTTILTAAADAPIQINVVEV